MSAPSPESPRSDAAAALDPARARSEIDLRVRFAETDLMGIVHHATYLVWFEIGRVEWLRRRGVSYADWAARGANLAVAGAEVRYLRPARFDDAMRLETRLARVRSVSLDFSYVLRRGEERLAEGSTRLACVDASTRLVRLPDFVRETLLAGELAAGAEGGAP